MTLEAILKQVRAQGQDQAEQVRQETAQMAEEILAKAREQAAAHREQELNEVTRTIERMEAQELPTARLEVERQKLVMLNGLLDQVRQKALDRMAGLPAADRRALYKQLMASTSQVTGVLRCPAKDAAELEKLTGCKAGDPLEEPGFTIEGAEARLDLRFATLVESAWPDHLKEVYATLLGEPGG